MSAAPYRGERFNNYSHLLGAVAATVGAGILIVLAGSACHYFAILFYVA